MDYSNISLNDDVLVDQFVAARLINTKPSTLQKWRCTGENNIPFVKIGRSVKYRTSDLREYVERHTHNKQRSVA